MQVARHHVHSAPRSAGRCPALSFDLSDLSELVAYLRPGANIQLSEHVCAMLFPGASDQPFDVVARCGSWARERRCVPRRSRQHGWIEFTKLEETAPASLPRPSLVRLRE